MLLLARKAGESVVIDGNIRITVDRIRRRVVQLKVEAPTEIQVDREEVWNSARVRTNRARTDRCAMVLPTVARRAGRDDCVWPSL